MVPAIGKAPFKKLQKQQRNQVKYCNIEYGECHLVPYKMNPKNNNNNNNNNNNKLNIIHYHLFN